MGKGKKDKKTINKNDNEPTEDHVNVDENDIDSEDVIESLTKNVKKLKVTSKNKNKNKSKHSEDDDEEEIAPISKNAKKKSGFDLLMDDDDEDDGNVNDNDGNKSNDDLTEDNNKNKKQKVIKQSIEEEDEKPTTVTAGKKSKKSKKKRNDDDDEDIDKVLAELEMEYSGNKKPVEIPNENKKNDLKQKKSKKQEDNSNENNDAAVVNVENGDEEDASTGAGTVKSAAQKKKEKKERQKREAALLKQQQQSGIEKEKEVEKYDEITEIQPMVKKVTKSKKVKELKQDDTDKVLESETVSESLDIDHKIDEIKEDTKDDKKKKKKGKQEKEEKDKGKKKGVSSSVVAAMQERLQKLKDEEERLKLEEEERIRKEEELENYRLEQIRLEAERKEKKKQREHDRKARLKAEGKLLTPKQKLEKARAQGMLESLKAQGVEVPEVVEKRSRAGTRVRPNKKKDAAQQQQQQEEQQEQQSENNEDVIKTFDEKMDTNAGEQEQELGNEIIVEEIKEDVKEAWDASSSEDESQNVKAVVTGNKAKVKKQESKEKESESNSVDESDDESGGGSDDDDDDDSDDDGESDDDDDDDDDEGDQKTDAEIKKEKAWERLMKRRTLAEQKRSVDNLRAAVVCVLGHVDTGKTKILDKLRRTNVQDGEAGGITQQIGATNVPIENIKEQTKIVKGFADMQFKLPGLLIIDTPGHESFSNLRSRGSSLCDIAILVVDIMHGLEPQTIESINLLKAKKTPFVVALNKIDRLYDWITLSRKDVRDVLKGQAANTQLEFEKRTQQVILEFSEQGLNAALFYNNPDPRTYVNLVPTSAITGEGMGNLLFLIIESCQSWLSKRLMYSDELQATVLEVKAIPGLGTTIDAILINGKLREGDTMVIAGTDGPIVTQIRSLLMPQPMKELRVKNAYIEYKEILAAQGVKIAAKELEKAIAGLNLYVAQKPDEIEICREEVTKELKSALSHIKLSGEGVYVQASTLGSLEALLQFLKSSKIPYANIRIGPVVKRDVMKASTMLEHESQYATILAFDVKIEKDAQELADSLGVKIFQADIIYHLFDKFTAYRDELKRKKRDEFKSIAVFPCKLRILPQYIFNSRDPIVVGVMIEAGIVKEGTPICVPTKEFLDVGIVTSIECNHKQVETARKGQEVCIKIDPIPGESPKMYGRHFDETDMLVSKISRQSIDACKDYFRDDLVKTDWALMVDLKKQFQIL